MTSQPQDLSAIYRITRDKVMAAKAADAQVRRSSPAALPTLEARAQAMILKSLSGGVAKGQKDGYSIDQLMSEGEAAEKKVESKDVDPSQLKTGIKIEYEHTTSEAVAQKIALDHLAEHDTYYLVLPIAEVLMIQLGKLSPVEMATRLRDFKEFVMSGGKK